MLTLLVENRYAVTASILFAVGFLHVLLHPDLIRSADPDKQILDLDLPDGLL